MNYPNTRNRRLRYSEAIRSLSRENSVSPNDFIVPLFIEEGKNQKNEIASMPGYFRYSLDVLKNEVRDIKALGLKSVLLFVKVPDSKKDNAGKEALNPNGLMQQSIKMIKDLAPELCVMTDVAMDPYSEYGHDGLVEDSQIVNDPSNQILANMALSHAAAGADFVAPSDMMDGRIKAIREKLEVNNFHNTGILAYSAKYASCFYGPFRDALDSAPGFGDKNTYQMDPANSREAIKEAQMDQQEGADILMVKPAGPYLDVIREVKNNTQLPIAAYQVSGEYAMIKAASKMGWLDEKSAMLESVLGIKRAGADMIASYFAKDIVKELS